MPKPPADIPQILAIVRPSADGKVPLKKDVLKYLGAGACSLFLDTGNEVMLSASPSVSAVPAEMQGTRAILPLECVAKIGLEKGDLLAMVQRDGALALKRLAVVEQEGDRARYRAEIVDLETPTQLNRVVRTNPMPDELLPRLAQEYRDLYLKHRVEDYARQRKSLEGWLLRRLLGIPGGNDANLRESLVRDRLERQGADGSWKGQVVLTARNMRELGQLGLSPHTSEMRTGAEWLLARSESQANPGMFFLSDELVAEQSRILEQRASGVRERFRERKKGEMRLVDVGDDLIREPCGPRIMWPNALVLEALLDLGYEGHERVQRALSLMTTHEWCECGYQHGLADWRRSTAPTEDDLDAFEANCLRQYRYGGLTSVDGLAKMDLTLKSGMRLYRASHRHEGEQDVYPLGMPDHLQLCEVMTVRAMSQVRDTAMRRYSDAHLWRFAGCQHGPNGEFEGRDVQRFFNEGQAMMLGIFAGYDHPASKVAIMRSIPWVVATQNVDGSWGKGLYSDAATLCVVRALKSLGGFLPEGMRI